MIWAFAVAAVTILYLALRFRRFQSWVEPVLTIVVAFGLVAALLIWFTEDRIPDGAPVSQTTTTAQPVIATDAVALSGLDFVAGRPATSYRITGDVTNRGDVALQSFRLTVTLEDCPDGTCRTVGSDSGLIIQRLSPGQTASFTTFAVFPGIDVVPVTAPKWSWTVSEPRAHSR